MWPAVALVAASILLVPAAAAAPSPHLEWRLAQLASAARDGHATAASSGLRVDSHGVEVVLEAARGRGAAVKRALRSVGATDRRSYRNLYQARVPVSALDTLAALDGVRVRAPYRPSPQSLEGMAPRATGSVAWLAAGVQGAGVKVAVIDVGFWHWQDRVAESDLPPGTELKSYCDNAEQDTHGTGMAETVYDQAPGADLLLICIDSDVELGIAKDYARAQGADIVVSALAFFGTSRGDGSGGPSTPEGIAADATASGMLWVAAAGNQAMQHWGGNFTDTDGDHWHEWSGTDETQWPILDPPERPGCFYLRWDGWPTARRDLDLYAYRYSDGALLASSQNPQRLGGVPPTETLCIQGSTAGVELKVLDRSAQIADAGCTKHCTPTVLPPVRIDFDYDWPGAEVHRAGLEHYTSDRSLAEPAGAPSVLTVGAFCVRTGELEPFSSRGPTPDGRIKPDLVAPDGDILSTPVFNYDGTCQTAGFRGTSAAAADAAAVAATVKSAMPEATPAELKTFLTERADDAGPAGTDSTWGAGRIRLRAFGDVPSSAAYAGASEELFRRKILRPRAGGKLEPAASVTRAEMAEYILRALGHADHLPPYRGYYSDLSATDPRTPWVEHLREHGIADVTSGAYRPDDPITHAEATGFLGRAAPGAELPPDNDPAAPLTRAELTLWIAAAWDMRWFKHLQGLVDDSVIVGDRVWFTDEAANTVNSYNFLTGKLEAPVTVGSKPREIDATPDGTKLVVTNLGSYDVSVIDTGSRSELRRVAIPRGNLGETPRSIATAADGSALVATTTLYYSGYTSHIYSLDPDTGAVRLREDLPAFADFGTTTEVTYVSPSLDHSRIFAVEGNSSAGNVWAYDSATDSRVGVAGMGDFVGYVAADREGDTVVVGPDLTLSRGDATVDHPIATSSGFGTAVSPGGTRLFTAGAGGLRVYDLASDGLLATLPLGDSVRDALSRTYIYTPVTRSAMDPAGRIVAVVTDGGLTLMPTGLDPSEPNLLPTDRDAPTVAIASGPSGSTTATSATFTFASGDPAARFQCSRDGQPLGACPNPVTFSALAEGPHELVVRAVDRAGNPSPKISRAWMVGTSENQPPPPDPPPSAPPPADEPAPVPVPAPTNEPAPPPPAGGAPVAPQPAVPADSSPAERGSMPSAALRPRAVRRPRIRGSLAVGRRATAYVGVWSGTPPLRIDVRWQRCDRNGHHCRTVARGRRYRIRAVNRARALRLVVSVRGPGGAATATAPARRVS